MNGRLIWRLILCPLAAAAPAAGAGAATSSLAFDSPARITETRADGLTIEFTPSYATHEIAIDGVTYRAVDADGYARLNRSGYPDLPFITVPFAVPPGASVAIDVVTNDEVLVPGAPPPPAPTERIEGHGDEATPVARLVPDAAFYVSGGLYPAEVAAAGDRGRLRFQDVAAVSLRPFRYDGAKHVLHVSTRLTVRVSWGAPAAMPKGLAPATADDRYWEPVYRSLLPNYEEARAWRSCAAVPRQPARAPALAPALEGPQWKIPVVKSDLYRVDASALAGLPPATAVGALRVSERIIVNGQEMPYEERDVPIHVVDADGDGTFATGDWFVFYGQSFPDRFAGADYDTLRTTDTHVYWLDLGGSGARMAEVPGDRGYIGLTPPSSFETWLHEEQNLDYFFQRTSLEQQDSWDTRRVRSDHFIWSGPGQGEMRLSYEVPAGVDPTGAAGLRARVQGALGTGGNGYTVSLAMAASGNTGDPGTTLPGTPFVVGLQSEYDYDSGGLTLPAGTVADGVNQLIYNVNALGLFFNSFDVGYMRRYQAASNRLDMTSGTEAGEREFHVTSFSTRSLLVFDVTDPRAPRFVTIDPAKIVRSGSTFTLTFQDSVAAVRSYVALAEAAITPAPQVVVETAPEVPLWDPSNVADYIMIVYDDFLDAVEPLKARREAQGYRVELVSASDVYDEFSGGSPTPAGIYRYLRWTVERRLTPPAYVLLGGDGSDDQKGYLRPRSMPNFLPSPVYFGNVSGDHGLELVAMDPRYVLNLTSPPGQADRFEDLFLGRLPAGSAGEMQAMVAKILAYENFLPEDSWRGSVLVVADDQFSSTTSFLEDYCWRSEEILFENASNATIADIHDEAHLADIVATPFFLSAYLDTVSALGRCHSVGCCVNIFTTQAYTYAHVTPLLQRKLSQGELMVFYQGHGNSALMSHEYVLVHSAGYARTDVDGISNFGRPFVFFGFACHLNQFGRYNEGGSGDSIDEEMMLASNRGAIASFASSAFEWLSTNPTINRAVSKAFFLRPPAVDLPSGDQTRWVLGPTLAAAKAYVVLDNSGPGANHDILGLVETYCLLGDPALRMDALPPEYLVTVNGEPYTKGTRLRAPAGTDSVTIGAEIRDELDVRPGSVQVSVGGVLVADTLFTVASEPDTPRVDNTLFLLSYRHELVPETYNIDISSVDLSGRTGTFRLPVVLEASFKAGNVTLNPNGQNKLPPAFDVVATLESPVELQSGDVTLLLDDRPVAASVVETSGSAGGSDWLVNAHVGEVEDGSHTLALRVDDGVHPAATRTVAFEVRANLALNEVFNFPNPFKDETRFHYTLSRDAARAQIRIYTLSGRLIRVLDGTVLPGKNMVPDGPHGWDGRDEDGDPVANGLYFYRVVVTSLDGKKLEVLGRMARAR